MHGSAIILLNCDSMIDKDFVSYLNHWMESSESYFLQNRVEVVFDLIN